MKKMSRLECNKETRRILNRGGVDLAYCQFSTFGMDVILTGWLCHTDGQEFTAQEVENVIYDFHRTLPGFTLSGDLDNWNFNSERITYVGDKNSSTLSKDKGGAEEHQVTYEIDLDDYDFDAS